MYISIDQLKKLDHDALFRKEQEGGGFVHESFPLKNEKGEKAIFAYEITEDGNSGTFIWDNIEDYLGDMQDEIEESEEHTMEDVRRRFEEI